MAESQTQSQSLAFIKAGVIAAIVATALYSRWKEPLHPIAHGALVAAWAVAFVYDPVLSALLIVLHIAVCMKTKQTSYFTTNPNPNPNPNPKPKPKPNPNTQPNPKHHPQQKQNPSLPPMETPEDLVHEMVSYQMQAERNAQFHQMILDSTAEILSGDTDGTVGCTNSLGIEEEMARVNRILRESRELLNQK